MARTTINDCSMRRKTKRRLTTCTHIALCIGYLDLYYLVFGGLGVQLARARFTQIGFAPVGLSQLRMQGPLREISPGKRTTKRIRHMGYTVRLGSSGFGKKSKVIRQKGDNVLYSDRKCMFSLTPRFVRQRFWRIWICLTPNPSLHRDPLFS
jgi:hypothetical protein